uniref:ATP synthase F0 subunit 8 n=1 Tax=Prionocidaris baculosa TaxID=1198993 RepID=UPI00165ED16F|nr:ATP synthase F0 subunit 8 [Prionocidaris baculosa]QLM01949.1 ATP synthase F0 subunit 8 [Prionocidaris baculosa]
MPQLEFSWWIINFFIIWIALAITFAIVTTSQSQNTPDSSSESSEIKKTTNTWQWS